MHKLTITIESDGDIENPCEGGDGQWKVISFNHRHTAYESPENYFTPVYDERGHFQYLDPISIGLRRKMAVGTAFLLGCYEHSGIAWSLSGEEQYCRFDSSSNAGLIIWEHSLSDMGAKTYRERAEDAKTSLETYNDWSNGYGLYYRIEDADGEDLDSCGGFYSSDSEYMYRDNIMPAIKSYMAENGLLNVVELSEDEAEDEEFEAEEGTCYVYITGDAADYVDLSDVYPLPFDTEVTAYRYASRTDIGEDGFKIGDIVAECKVCACTFAKDFVNDAGMHSPTCLAVNSAAGIAAAAEG